MEYVRVDIDHKELRRLSTLEPRKALGALAFDWLVIAASIAVGVHFANPFVYLACVVVISGRMHAIASLMHEATHYRIIENKKWSDWIADMFMAWPILMNMPSYRRNHVGHHIHLNTEQDPDWRTKMGKREFTFPAEARELLPHILGYLVFLSSIKDLMNYKSRVNTSKAPLNYRIAQAAYYLTIAAAVTWFGVWEQFLLYWAVPYMTIFLMLVYVRGVADHFGDMTYTNALTGTRTIIKPGIVVRTLVQPHNLQYHIEHHLFPSVPFYNLPQLHKLLMENETYRAQAHVSVGPIAVIRECLKRPVRTVEAAKAA